MTERLFLNERELQQLGFSESNIATFRALTAFVNLVTRVDDAETSLTQKQPLDATLTAFAALVGAADKLPYFTADNVFALADFTGAGRALVDDADATAQRTTLGLGTIATQAASAVAITGGTIAGITSLDVAGEARCNSFRIDVAPTATGDVAATHTLTFSADGSTYKFLLTNV